jgi:cell division protein FtsN
MNASTRTARSPRQRGGFAMGLIVGLLIGLALALGVALYVTKAPNPFVNKVPQRSPVLDAAEAERNRNWDPNAALAGKTAMRPASGASAPLATAIPPSTGSQMIPPALAPSPVPSTGEPRSPAVAAAPAARASGAGARADATGRDPSRDLALGRDPATPPPRAPVPTAGGNDPFTYFVQAGAYGRSEDAEQQRARLAMLGIEARLTERDQAGRTVYRVRVGPFDRKEDADAAKERLSDAGVDSALVRVQK